MVCSMFKKAVLGTALGAGLLYMAFGTSAPSYVRTAVHKVRHNVKAGIPDQFNIEKARQEIAALEPAIRDNIEILANAMVEVEFLDREIVAIRGNLETEKKAILALRDRLESGDFRLAGHGRVSYTSEEVKADLARRLDSYRDCNRVLHEKEETLKARQKSVVAARKLLTEMAAQKQALQTRLDGIEARIKTIEATRATNEFNFDDSALARAKKSIAELEKRVEVLDRKAEMEGRFTDGIPVNLEPDRDVVKEVDEVFGADPGASTPTAQGDNATPRDTSL